MSFLENAYFKSGGVTSPLTDSLTNTSLRDADPALYYVLRYYYGVIRLHVGPRFDAEVNACGLNGLIDKVINQVVPYDPTPIATQDTYKFPLLSGYRKQDEFTWKTSSWYNIISTIDIIYSLPPLSSEQLKRLHPLLTHISRTLCDRTLEGLDENHNSGQEVWGLSGLEKIEILNCSYGKIPGLQSDIYFPSISLSLKITERRDIDARNFSTLTGVDGYVDAGDVMDGYGDYNYFQFQFDL